MARRTALTRRLGIDLPIIQAPMGGANATPPALVSAVSDAGGLGFVGAAYMSADAIRDTCAEIRARTTRPFGINLFAPVPPPPPPTAAELAPALAHLSRYHEELALPAPTRPAPVTIAFDDQLAAALDGGARVFSFTFGTLPAATVSAIQARGVIVIGTATTVGEAAELEESGVDAVVAQGSEAGAHRGTFAAPFESSMIGTIALVPQVLDAVRVPVIASGGIMDGRGIAAALALGAGAAQMGTAFLTCDECGIAECWKESILAAREDETRITRAFSGRPARGIVNRFMTETDEAADAGAILPYPWQNALTRPMRNAAAASGRAELLSLWAGQGVRLARRESAADLVRRLARQTEEAIERLGG